METKICDKTYLENFTGGDKERIKKYISIFLSTAPPALEKLNNYYSTSDWNGVRATAHALKPQFTIMGIKPLESVIKELEEYSSTRSNLEKIPELMSNINQITPIALQELKQTLTEQ